MLVRATGNDENERHANNDVGNGHRLAARLDFAGPRDRGLDQISTHVKVRTERQDSRWASVPGLGTRRALVTKP